MNANNCEEASPLQYCERVFLGARGGEEKMSISEFKGYGKQIKARLIAKKTKDRRQVRGNKD